MFLIICYVWFFSLDIGMFFGIAKCAHVGIRQGNICASNGYELFSGDLVKDLSNNERVSKNFDICHGLLRRKVSAEYKRRVRSSVFSSHIFKATNTFNSAI